MYNLYVFLFTIYYVYALTETSSSSSVTSSSSTSSSSIPTFEEWKIKYNKIYDNLEINNERQLIYENNVNYINKRNSEINFVLGVNEYSDLSNEEYKKIFLSNTQYQEKYDNNDQTNVILLDNDPAPPSSIDWRSKGAVTPVKNQGQCGSCWAFSTTGSIEGRVKIAPGGKLTSLSEQQLLDCASSFENAGCNGGLMDDAFKYVVANGGIDSEADYKYIKHKSLRGCNKSKSAKHVSTIHSFHDVKANSETQLQKAVSEGPVSVAIEADKAEFQHYKSGVLDFDCGTNLDHGVLVVGYGQQESADGDIKKYWIVKNSWGASWGDNGYIKIKRDVSADEGMCGIAMQPSYPVVNSEPISSLDTDCGTHYNNPKDGCQCGDSKYTIHDVTMCVPSCISTKCPAKPQGWNIKASTDRIPNPNCFHFSDQYHLCVLLCDSTQSDSCDPEGKGPRGVSTCTVIKQGYSICTYKKNSPIKKLVDFIDHEIEEIMDDIKMEMDFSIGDLFIDTTPSTSHWNDPYTSTCDPHDVAIKIEGVKGAICTPKCESETCDGTPAPTGWGATARCLLRSPKGHSYCALQCKPENKKACSPSINATCKSIQGIGICTYDKQSTSTLESSAHQIVSLKVRK